MRIQAERVIRCVSADIEMAGERFTVSVQREDCGAGLSWAGREFAGRKACFVL
ncbi:MAG: hypothetical protein MJA29_13245 [Candidatus Omnitrophica bacterium]|nr:hypothetical protein [Candidatus Omnitrophota bacterium]